MLSGKNKNKGIIDAGPIDGSDAVESDWKPFVQYADEEAGSDGIFEDAEEIGIFGEAEEADNKDYETENQAEQYAFSAEDADSIGESQARYDGSSPETSQGYKDAEIDGP